MYASTHSLASRTALVAVFTLGALTLAPGATAERGAQQSRLVPSTTASASSTKRTTKRKSTVGDRDAAQRGLDFLQRASVAWGDGHACYGCHVHAVTLEAFVTGKENQYRVAQKPIANIIAAMTTGEGGTQGKNGLSYHGGSLLAPSKAFGGAALAHYDLTQGADLRDDLIQTARELLAFQQPDGHLQGGYDNRPVAIGDTQSTYQAVQTWRQAYARTADTLWLTPIRNAETYLRALATQYAKTGTDDLQQLNYAALGLVEAGANQNDAGVQALRGEILEKQDRDGAWRLFKNGAPSAFATGQSLYVLRKLGMSDNDKAIKRGTAWLISAQQKDGSWSSSGSNKAEAMWGVLGLVSIDVLSIEIVGIGDGEHLPKTKAITVRATDNVTTKGVKSGVKSVRILLDDNPIGMSPGATFSTHIDPSALDTGLHIIEVVAENINGKTARRRVSIYVGDYFITDVGSRFQNGSTVFSLRNLATEEKKGKVEVRIYDEKDTAGKTPLATVSTTTKSGPMRATWDGKLGKKAAKGGRYRAEVVYLGDDNKPVHTVDHLFSHVSEDEAKKRYGAVTGNLQGGGRDMANTEVELVDGLGNVVQKVRSTRSGQYRFKNVDDGDYKVRVKKKGWAAPAAPVRATAGEESQADAELMQQ